MRPSMSILRPLILIGMLSGIMSAQVDGLAEVRFNSQKKPQSIFIDYKLTDPTCVRSTRRNLKLVTIKYLEDDPQRIDTLILADSRNRREEYILDLYFGDFIGAHEGWAKKMIGEGLIYNVGIFICGATGRADPQIYSLELASVVSKGR